MVSGGSRLRPQEDSLNMPVDMVVGTPGRILDHIEDGNMVYGDIKYLVCSKLIQSSPCCSLNVSFLLSSLLCISGSG